MCCFLPFYDRVYFTIMWKVVAVKHVHTSIPEIVSISYVSLLLKDVVSFTNIMLI